MRLKSILKTSCFSLFLLAPAIASGQIPTDVSAFMPSKAEMRQSLIDSGLPAGQIEGILNAMDFPEDGAETETGVSAANTPNDDANENGIDDTEETDPVITRCRKLYQTELFSVSTAFYGDDLGRNAIEVAQTCSMAAAGGSSYSTATIRNDSPGINSNGSTNADDLAEFLELGQYWNGVLSQGRYLSDYNGPIPEDLTEAEMRRLIDGFPRDMQRMMAVSNVTGFTSTDVAVSVYQKCERVRSRVGDNYSRKVQAEKVCLRHVPTADVPSSDTEDDGK